MTRTEFVARIMELLGFRTDSRTENVILQQLSIQQNRIELGATKPWFLLGEYASYPTTANEERIPVPDDFLSEHDEDGLAIYNSDEERYVSLVKNDLDELREIYKDAEPGLPEAYALAGGYFRLFPTPDDAYVIRMLYYAKEAPLTNGGDSNKFTTQFPELLMGMTGLRAAQILRDSAAQATFREMLAEARAEMYRQNELRSHANASYQIGGQH